MIDNDLNHDPSESLKTAFRRHASGVAVITTKSETGEPVGFTATSMTSLGANPAMVTFNVSQGSSSWPALSSATHLALHMLGAKNLGLAKKMAEDRAKRFADSDWEFSEFGLPVFTDATAVLFAKVKEFHLVGQNAVFVLEVLSGKLGKEDKGLLYFQRSYLAPADTAL